jgi:hypothetical protein
MGRDDGKKAFPHISQWIVFLAILLYTNIFVSRRVLLYSLPSVFIYYYRIFSGALSCIFVEILGKGFVR